MIMHRFDIVTAALPLLLVSGLRALVVAAVAAVGLAIFRTKAATERLFVWRTVLLAAVAMPLLAAILPSTPIPAGPFHSSMTPVVAARHSVTSAHDPSAVRIDTPIPNNPSMSTVSAAPSAQSQTSAKGTRSPWSTVPWTVLAGTAYLTIAGIFLARFTLGVFLSRRLIGASGEIDAPALRRALAVHASARPDTLQVLESESIAVPVTMGILRPVILLPSCWIEWNEPTLAAVIAHEASHVARRDALMQCISLLHRAVFWFSPLAWWLDRHLAALAEEASDEAALALGADRETYARTLLGFFKTLQTTPGRIRWQGVSMANGARAEQRLERILAWKGSLTMHLKKSAVIAIIVFAVPVIFLAASARPVSGNSSSADQEIVIAPPATASQMAPPAAALAPVGGVHAAGPTVEVSAPAIAPVSPVAPGVAPVDAIAPVAPVARYSWSTGQASASSHGPGYSFAYDNDDEERFVIVSGKSDSYTMSGSTQDVHHVERLKKQISGDFIWFQRDEKSYIIRDQATVDRAKAFWAPQAELGKKQEELGKQQEALGKQQEELGKRMEQVHVNVPTDLTAKLDALKAKLQKLGSTATMEQVGDLQSEIGELQTQIGEIQSKAGEQQGKLGEEQGKLGEQQGKLGEEQGKLGEEQGRLAEEAVKKTKALFDECIKNGKAQPEPDGSQGASL